MIKTAAFLDDVHFNDAKVKPQLVLETPFSKEIRIVFQKESKMNEHKAPFPITVQVLLGSIDFGVGESVHRLAAGDIIALEANISHDLVAVENSVVRLTLSKQDQLKRVEGAV